MNVSFSRSKKGFGAPLEEKNIDAQKSFNIFSHIYGKIQSSLNDRGIAKLA